MLINCLGLMRFAGSSTSPIQATAQPCSSRGKGGFTSCLWISRKQEELLLKSVRFEGFLILAESHLSGFSFLHWCSHGETASMKDKNLGESHLFVFPSSFVFTLLRNTSLPQLPTYLSRGMAFYKQPLIGTSAAWGSH